MCDDNDSVAIQVSALVTAQKALSDANSSAVRSWQGEDAGSFVAKKDEFLVLSGLGGLGLPVLKVKVIGSSGLRPPDAWPERGDCLALQNYAAWTLANSHSFGTD